MEKLINLLKDLEGGCENEDYAWRNRLSENGKRYYKTYYEENGLPNAVEMLMGFFEFKYLCLPFGGLKIRQTRH